MSGGKGEREGGRSSHGPMPKSREHRWRSGSGCGTRGRHTRLRKSISRQLGTSLLPFHPPIPSSSTAFPPPNLGHQLSLQVLATSLTWPAGWLTRPHTPLNQLQVRWSARTLPSPLQQRLVQASCCTARESSFRALRPFMKTFFLY